VTSDPSDPNRRYRCRLCGAPVSSSFTAREMMHGTREIFAYIECPNCGCVQIAEIPDDLARFYPRDYYSFQLRAPSLARRMKNSAGRALIGLGNLAPPLSHVLRRRFQRLSLFFLYEEATHRNRDAAILDVGSGAGELLKDLVDIGYRNLLGIDRFIQENVCYRGRVLVEASDIFQVAGRRDVVTFHHSLEHMPEQTAVLSRARAILNANGRVIVRIPIVGGEAWELYRAQWVQLDPPRHLYLHSLKSLALVAEQAGLRIARLDYDTTGFQFWGSELYRRDIPLNDRRSPACGETNSVFTAAEMAAFERKARQANARGRGDQIIAWLATA